MSEADIITAANPPPRSPLRLALRIALGSLAIFVGIIVLIVVLQLREFRAPRTQRAFDSADWQASGRAWIENGDRLCMVDNLLAEHSLKGRDQVQLEALLGPPDSDPYLLIEQPRRAGAHIYRLGPDHLGLDDMWLVVTWDATKHVADAIVVSD